MRLVILVVDDNLVTRLSVKDYLELSGYSVITAEDGQQALSLIESDRPNILVTATDISPMGGHELVRQVRQKPAFRLLPVIFLTQCTSTEERIKCYPTGHALYLAKPFEMEELGAVIRNFSEREIQKIEEPPNQALERFYTIGTLDLTQRGKQVLQHLCQKRSNIDTLDLTQREKQVLQHMCEERSNSEIGELLHLSPRTVEKHRNSILRKLGTDETGGAEPSGGVRVPRAPNPSSDGTAAEEELSVDRKL